MTIKTSTAALSGAWSFERPETVQEVYYGVLHAGDFLTAEERDVLRWGGNAKVTVPPRFSKSGSHAVTYKRATALECLVSCGLHHARVGLVADVMASLTSCSFKSCSWIHAAVDTPGMPDLRFRVCAGGLDVSDGLEAAP